MKTHGAITFLIFNEKSIEIYHGAIDKCHHYFFKEKIQGRRAEAKIMAKDTSSNKKSQEKINRSR